VPRRGAGVSSNSFIRGLSGALAEGGVAALADVFEFEGDSWQAAMIGAIMAARTLIQRGRISASF